MTDIHFTNGTIAAKEHNLLGEKLLRFTEMTAEEVLRALSESGFGGGEAEPEAMLLAEERALDAFIREYAPSEAEKLYLLAPRDFHNAKALCKAEKLHESAENMLAPEGLIAISDLTEKIREGAYAGLPKELAAVVKNTLENEQITGAQIGADFDNALYRYLLRSLRRRGLLKSLLVRKADMENILSVMRAGSYEQAEKLLISCGKLGKKQLSLLSDADAAWEVMKATPYAEFFALCKRAQEKSMPYTEAERYLESFEAEYFRAKQYELEGKEPFLYYVFRRRAEIANVRIVLVCLNAGLPAQDIRRRLRAI